MKLELVQIDEATLTSVTGGKRHSERCTRVKLPDFTGEWYDRRDPEGGMWSTREQCRAVVKFNTAHKGSMRTR